MACLGASQIAQKYESFLHVQYGKYLQIGATPLLCLSCANLKGKCKPFKIPGRHLYHAIFFFFLQLKHLNIVLHLPNLLGIIDMDEGDESIKLWLQH